MSFAHIFFASGFRPFFFGAGVYAVFCVLLWILVYGGGLGFALSYPPSFWHAHEMVFGYGSAAAAGFLLTAVPNWTGRAGWHPTTLITLFSLWLAGRVVMVASLFVPLGYVALVDVLFLPALTWVVSGALRGGGSSRSYIFPLLVCVQVTANVLFHLEALDLTSDTMHRALVLNINAFSTMIAIIGGRVTPGFTKNALALEGITITPRRGGKMDAVAFLLLALMLVSDAIEPNTPVSGALALAACLAHAWRLSGWYGWKTYRSPLLLVLHVGYLWLVAGLLLKGLAALGIFLRPADAIHALAIGAIGTMTLALMTRATLGHTGRDLVAGPVLTVSYALVSLAVLVRIFLPAVSPERMGLAILASALLWVFAYVLYIGVCAPMQLRPRLDGRPG